MNNYKFTNITLKDNNFKITTLFSVGGSEYKRVFVFGLNKKAEEIKEEMNNIGLTLQDTKTAHTLAELEKAKLVLNKSIEIKSPPKASDFESKVECEKAGFYWYNNKCNASQEEII